MSNRCDPFGSLSPRLSIGQIVAEVLAQVEADRRAALAVREEALVLVEGPLVGPAPGQDRLEHHALADGVCGVVVITDREEGVGQGEGQVIGSLLVGAVGILTMMWIAVGERTNEIGLVRAIGASRRQVHWMFLIEAAALTAPSVGSSILSRCSHSLPTVASRTGCGDIAARPRSSSRGKASHVGL